MPETVQRSWYILTVFVTKLKMTAEIQRFWKLSGVPDIGLINEFRICLENYLLFVKGYSVE